MKRRRLSAWRPAAARRKQIIAILKEHEAGVPVAELCCAASTVAAMPASTNGKPYGGMDISEARRLRALEDENASCSGCWRT